MARIISLGCEVAHVHGRYSAIHRALFGVSSYRLVVASLTGREVKIYREYERTLDELEGELAKLTTNITAIGEHEKRVRSAEQVHTTLLEYIQTLRDVIRSLGSIYHKLGEDEKGYRSDPGEGPSQFNQDKIGYDHSRQQLERVGTRINKLFSTY
jgi:hypothetical protein